jgi:hypothetical protein
LIAQRNSLVIRCRQRHEAGRDLIDIELPHSKFESEVRKDTVLCYSVD